ncbi:MAG TPA: serine/threonine-protein kinase, partial [Planctomycetaceae bacterium]|nr:serine/threonine-protein kinase [Planctomycetaceae bacterium]
IDGRGAVWITDFGLAHVAADAGLTQTGDLVGTLRYMSPEQAAGRRTPVDHRADVYSLGATLYELLTLQPLFAGPDRAKLLHQILNEEPRPLRQWDRAIPLELETIVLKALSKNPADRYGTAGAMAADLRRFLDEIPILARRPTVVDRARKWMRRHPSVVASTVLLLVCGVLGLSVAMAVVFHQQWLTQQAYDRESQRATEAEARFELAQSAADEMIRLAEEDLSDAPFQEGLRKRLLQTALDYYQQFIKEREADPAAQAQLAITRDRVQKILADLSALQFDRQGFLLRESAVLDDLKLTEDQRRRVDEWADQIDSDREENVRNPDGLRPDEMRPRIIAQARAHEEALSAILSPAERKRLRQIGLQWDGPRALREPDVQRTLKLTAEQKHQIHAVEVELMFHFERRRGGRPGGPNKEHPGVPNDEHPGGPRPHWGGGGPRDDGPPHREGPKHPDGPRPFFTEMTEERWKEALQKMEAVLTPEQLARWRKMTGPAYAGPISLPGRERGRPRF